MLHSGSSGRFDEHEQCDQARRDGSSTEQQRELASITSATEREDKGNFCVYSAVDEIKSSPAVGARRKKVHHNLLD